MSVTLTGRLKDAVRRCSNSDFSFLLHLVANCWIETLRLQDSTVVFDRAASLLMSAAEHRLEETVQGGGECNSVILQARLARDLVHFQYPGNQAVAIW